MKKTINWLSDKLFHFDEWRVGIINVQELDAIISTGVCESEIIRWLEIDGKHYQADPFLCEIDSKLVLLYESMSHWTGIGKIKCVDLEGRPLVYCNSMAKRQGHQSFPFVFEEGDSLYCLPETGSERKLILFRFCKASKGFEPHQTIIDNENVVDSFIYIQDGVFYLFCTHKEDGDYVQRLYYSNELTKGYVEHVASPIARGLSNGRNAGGLLSHSGRLYRVTQECTNFYGQGINFYLVKKLSKDSYEEHFKFPLDFKNSYKYGHHTISTYKDWIVIDGKERCFSIFAPFMKITSKIVKYFNA